MTAAPDTPMANQVVRAPIRHRDPSPRVLEAGLGLVLNAVRQGDLAAFVARHRRALAWAGPRLLAPALEALDDTLVHDVRLTRAALAWLESTVASLRPDGAAGLNDIDEESWLSKTSWRPMLSVGCHCGVLKVPDFPLRYRRHRDEGVVDNLCGLWAVGSSTFYRYLDKGKRALVEAALRADPGGERAVALRDLVTARWAPGTPADAARIEWHGQQARRAVARRASGAALWHFHAARDIDAFTATLHRGRSELARSREAEVLAHRLEQAAPTGRQRFDVTLAMAALDRHRHDAEGERLAYDRALRIAVECGDPLLVATVYERIGWFQEARDRDQAIAAFRESLRLVRGLSEGGDERRTGDALADRLLAALVGLAWMHVMVNDPTALDLLNEAEKLRGDPALPGEPIAMLEQAWSEYYRRASDMQRSLEARLRALTIFERLGDTRWIASASNNLAVIYLELGNHDKAIASARRVVDLSLDTPVDPYVLASAIGNIGIAYYWMDELDTAIHWYEKGLSQAILFDLPVLAHRARFNLAEARYRRFTQTGDPRDEAAGDAAIASVMAAKDVERDAVLVEAAPRLKSEILGTERTHVFERLVSEEAAVHVAEMARVASARRQLALESLPANRIAAHLELAAAYAAVAAKELAAARELADQHGLASDFLARTQSIERALHREVDDSHRRAADWRRRAHGLVPDARIDTLLDELARAGSVNKSGYSRLMDVALATASKHLATLAERGLLVQAGRGPSTRYVLPERENSEPAGAGA